MKSIFLAEGENHVREALRLALAQRSDWLIVGGANTTESLLAHVCRCPPDVILVDWRLPGFHPQRLLIALRECCPRASILATSVQPEHESLAHQCGFDAFLSKQLPPDQFVSALVNATNPST